jgi:hypothetical protein
MDFLILVAFGLRKFIMDFLILVAFFLKKLMRVKIDLDKRKYYQILTYVNPPL